MAGADACSADVTNRESLDAAFRAARTPAILIANAGTLSEAEFREHTQEQWDGIAPVDLSGAFRSLQSAARPMGARGRRRRIRLKDEDYPPGRPGTPLPLSGRERGIQPTNPFLEWPYGLANAGRERLPRAAWLSWWGQRRRHCLPPGRTSLAVSARRPARCAVDGGHATAGRERPSARAAPPAAPPLVACSACWLEPNRRATSPPPRRRKGDRLS